MLTVLQPQRRPHFGLEQPRNGRLKWTENPTTPEPKGFSCRRRHGSCATRDGSKNRERGVAVGKGQFSWAWDSTGEIGPAQMLTFTRDQRSCAFKDSHQMRSEDASCCQTDKIHTLMRRARYGLIQFFSKCISQIKVLSSEALNGKQAHHLPARLSEGYTSPHRQSQL